MGKIIKLTESDLVRIVKKVINESAEKRKNTVLAILNYLTKKFKNSQINKDQFIDILTKLNFKEYTTPLTLLNFYNNHVKEGVKWVDYVDEIVDFKTAMKEFINGNITEFIDISGSHSCDIEQGNNNFEMIVEISFEYLGETYSFPIGVDVGFYYSYDSGDYYQPPDSSIDDEWLDVTDSTLEVYDEEGNDFYFDLDKTSIQKLETFLLSRYDADDCSIS